MAHPSASRAAPDSGRLGFCVNFAGFGVSEAGLARCALLAAIIAAGCAGAPARAPVGAIPVLAVEVPLPAAVPLGGPAPAAKAEALPEIGLPPAVACRFVSESFSHSKLRLSPAGPVFAGVRDAAAVLFFPATTPAPAAVLEVDQAKLLLRAHVASSELPVYLRRPTALMGFVYPHAATSLSGVGGKQGSVRVELDASAVLRWPEHPGADVACAQLALTTSDYEVRDIITKKKMLPELSVGHDGAGLSLEPKGRAVAGLKAGSVAQILESRGGESRVLIEVGDFSIVGWVASGALGNGFGTGRGRLGGRHHTRRYGWTGSLSCDHDLELVAEAGGTRARVGVIQAGARFESTAPSEEPASADPPPRRSRNERRWRPVSFPQIRWLEVEEGARLLIDEAELSTCVPAEVI